MDTPQTLLEAVRYFSDLDTCQQYMADIRWPDGKPVCPKCGCDRTSPSTLGRWPMCREIQEIHVGTKVRGQRWRFRRKVVFTKCRHGLWRAWCGRPGRFWTKNVYTDGRYRPRWIRIPDAELPEEVKDQLYALAIQRGQ